MKKNQIFICALLSFATISVTLKSCRTASDSLPSDHQQARTAPEWITKGIMYQVQPRAFTPEGTLRAASDRLPGLAELGINILYLCPVFVADDDMDTTFWSPRQKASGMNNPRNPYRMKDYYHIDPEYGNDDDLRNFIAAAHRHNIRVMLDMVYLHCGPTAVFLKEHPDFIKRDEKGNPINAAWAFPALNFANTQLREYLWNNMEYWTKEFDVDGFRCDVASNIPLDFWETARQRLEKIRPDIGMLAEGERKEDQIMAFDLNYSFTWFNSLRRVMEKKESVSNLRTTWEKMADINPDGSRFIRYTDNHDIANDAYYDRIEESWGPDGVNATLVMNFMLDGVPFLYNGQEIADTSRHSIFGRLAVNWVMGDSKAGKDRFNFCKELIELRKNEPCLTEGEVMWIENDAPDKVLSFTRTYGKNQVLVIINLREQPVKTHLSGQYDSKSVSILLTNGTEEISDQNEFDLQGYGFLVKKMKARKKV